MSGQAQDLAPAVRGTIRRRLLVNAVVDPDEAARRLPPGLRPHVTAAAPSSAAACWRSSAIRPAGLPAVLGMRLRAVAHRISVEWDDGAGGTVRVYVPVRHTDSRLAVGPRRPLVPGRARARPHRGRHRDGRPPVAGRARSTQPTGRRSGSRRSVSPRAAAERAIWSAATCLGAAVGLSPDHRGGSRRARMEPSHRDARAVTVDELESEFIGGFATARPATSYLMCDAEVTWTRAAAPRSRHRGARHEGRDRGRHRVARTAGRRRLRRARPRGRDPHPLAAARHRPPPGPMGRPHRRCLGPPSSKVRSWSTSPASWSTAGRRRRTSSCSAAHGSSPPGRSSRRQPSWRHRRACGCR